MQHLGRVAVDAVPSTSGRGKQLREEPLLQHRSGEAQLSAEQLQRSQELVGRLRGKLVSGMCMQLLSCTKSHITLSCLLSPVSNRSHLLIHIPGRSQGSARARDWPSNQLYGLQ